MAVKKENWKEFVPNAVVSEIWDLGLLHLDVLKQKAHKYIFLEKRTYDITLIWTNLVTEGKKKQKQVS